MSSDNAIYIHKSSESNFYYVAHLVSFYPEDYTKKGYPDHEDEFLRNLPYKKKLDVLFGRMVPSGNCKRCETRNEAYEEANLMLAERGFLVEHGVLEI